MVLASAVRPDMAQPIWESISTIFSIEEDSRRIEVTRFSTPRTTPSDVQTPMAVEPSYVIVSFEKGKKYFNCLDGVFNLEQSSRCKMVKYRCYPSGEN